MAAPVTRPHKHEQIVNVLLEGPSSNSFDLLGDRFSPRLADIGGTRFWQIDARADDGPLNRVARQSVNLDRITPQDPVREPAEAVNDIETPRVE